MPGLTQLVLKLETLAGKWRLPPAALLSLLNICATVAPDRRGSQ